MKTSWKSPFGALLGLGLLVIGCAEGKSPPASPADENKGSRSFKKLEPQPDASHWLGPDAARAKAAGAEDGVVLAVEAAAAGDRVAGRVSVPLDDCVLLMARASATVNDVDLAAYADDGTMVAIDELEDEKPTLLVCPPHPSNIYVSARVVSGHGLVAIGAQQVVPEHAKAVEKAVSSRERNEQADRSRGWPGLKESLASHRLDIGGSWEDWRQVALPLDPAMPTTLSAIVERESCLDVLVLPSTEVSHLELAVVDEQGRHIGRGVSEGRKRAAVICSAVTAPISIKIRPHAGRGLAVVALSRLTEGSVHSLDPDAPRLDLTPLESLNASRLRHEEQLEDSGYLVPRTVAEGDLLVGRRTSKRFDLPGGCARIDVIAAAPALGVEAWLWDDEGSLIARERGHGWAELFACGRGAVRLDAEALLRPGEYIIQMRQDREAPDALTEHQLAGSRLVSSMVKRGIIRRASEVGNVRVFSLHSHELRALEALVPIGRCVDFTVAVGPGAGGVELRLVDRDTDEELSLARGVEVAAARACALDRSESLNVRAELRATVGEATALAATRMLVPSP